MSMSAAAVTKWFFGNISGYAAVPHLALTPTIVNGVRIVGFGNSLPQDVISAPNVNIFKNRLDKF